jgi:glycosyltransferase involved in cell wall biosynthesis
MLFDLVSVIIPAYNAEEYILQCVNSVIEQTYFNLEIIIVNDGSTDKTLQLIQTLDDKRIVLINQENRGSSSARNSGIVRAAGEYFQFLDADDVLSPNKIESQLRKMHASQKTIAVCKTLYFNDDIRRPLGEIDTELIQKEGSGLKFLLRLLGSEGKSGMVQPNAYLIPASIVNIIGEWNVDITPTPDDDGEYFTRALLAAEHIVFTGGINYYRKVPNQKSLSHVRSYQLARNLLKTVEMKFDHIFKIERSQLTERLFQLNISQVAYQCGCDYPEIVKESREILRGNSFSSLKVCKPWKFKIISFLIGFENAIWLKKILK